ncbi:hypothetical protein BLA29_012135 [Euroglyphus maynei]|uniref:Uncharacterized protein n=1 Tax=Euroglyphus maynei TaxID=6958 RepID=A0A1Y3AWR7_EURMA|nr:hypothetical protein BLA29_012135 [Euroglyphus maynei]
MEFMHPVNYNLGLNHQKMINYNWKKQRYHREHSHLLMIISIKVRMDDSNQVGMIRQLHRHIQPGMMVLELLLVLLVQIHSVHQQLLIMIRIKLGINQLIIITIKQQQQLQRQRIHPIMERWKIIIRQHSMRLVLNMYNLDQDIDTLIIIIKIYRLSLVSK